MKATCSSETPVGFQRTKRRYIPEDKTLHNYRCENLTSFIVAVQCVFLQLRLKLGKFVLEIEEVVISDLGFSRLSLLIVGWRRQKLPTFRRNLISHSSESNWRSDVRFIFCMYARDCVWLCLVQNIPGNNFDFSECCIHNYGTCWSRIDTHRDTRADRQHF
jgi:hypothetical protein